jgi:hypothetical protein
MSKDRAQVAGIGEIRDLALRHVTGTPFTLGSKAPTPATYFGPPASASGRNADNVATTIRMAKLIRLVQVDCSKIRDIIFPPAAPTAEWLALLSHRNWFVGPSRGWVRGKELSLFRRERNPAMAIDVKATLSAAHGSRQPYFTVGIKKEENSFTYPISLCSVPQSGHSAIVRLLPLCAPPHSLFNMKSDLHGRHFVRAG